LTRPWQMGWAQVEIRIAIQSFIDSGAAVGLGFNSPQENVLMTQVCMGAIAIVARCVFARTHEGITDASTTRRFPTPRTRQPLSTTAQQASGGPMAQDEDM